MTTLAATPKVRDLDLYEPSLEDKIQRIIYRLENGEKLIRGNLRSSSGDFCVMGLFADESGLGKWGPYGQSYHIYDKFSYKYLNAELTNYYGLVSGVGSFKIEDLPEDLQTRMHDMTRGDSSALAVLNDCFTPGINQLLADIIRSRAVFIKEK